MSTNQILIGIGLIFVLAVGSQVLATRLKVPPLIVLLPAGFIAGAVTSDVNPIKLLGPAFQPTVSVAVAVILYDSGLGLDPRNLRGHARKVVIRLLIFGVVFSFALTALSAPALLGLSARAAVMLGAILVVTGPTVVGP
ncbi:MAG TPA: cation:proton antiporter, partial [Streptosporangiaceae bacterium]|nr:cation:proton antiporter [Streptosporangiaceae bacterium]